MAGRPGALGASDGFHAVFLVVRDADREVPGVVLVVGAVGGGRGPGVSAPTVRDGVAVRRQGLGLADASLALVLEVGGPELFPAHV